MKINLLAILLFSTTLGYAHEVVSTCPKDGRVKMICSDFMDGGKQYVKISLSSGVWGNGSSDTLFKIAPSYSFAVYVPVPTHASITVTFQNTNQNGNANGEVYRVVTPLCESLPLTWGDFKIETVGVNTVKASVTVYDVSQVHRIEFRMRKEGVKEWLTKALVFPAEVKEGQTYSATFKIN